jgi:hypothetical protein
MTKKILWLVAMLCISLPAFSQTKTDSTKVSADEEPPLDFSQFSGDADVSTETIKDGVKRYCTAKIFGISPTKLVSVSYDYQFGYKMTTDKVQIPNTSLEQAETKNVSATHGLRLAANFPIISKNSITVNLGATYWETHYDFQNPDKVVSPLFKSLDHTALRSTGINLTVFKPLNEKNFILVQTSHDLNGDYHLSEFQSLGLAKHSLMAIFGWKKHDRLQFGFGAARTYRVGALNYIPVVLYNFTAENRKWGIEAVFPARVHYRRSFSPRSLLLFGYELEGNSYYLRNRGNVFGNEPTTNKPYDDLELRRSELRIRMVYETSLYQFIWLSVQAGYRYNWRNSYNIDRGDGFRSFFANDPYTFTNTVTNPLYFSVGINLVSP